MDAYNVEKLLLAADAMWLMELDPGDPPRAWQLVSLARWVRRYRAYRASNTFGRVKSRLERLRALAAAGGR